MSGFAALTGNGSVEPPEAITAQLPAGTRVLGWGFVCREEVLSGAHLSAGVWKLGGVATGPIPGGCRGGRSATLPFSHMLLAWRPKLVGWNPMKKWGKSGGQYNEVQITSGYLPHEELSS